MKRPETIAETADLVAEASGQGVAVATLGRAVAALATDPDVSRFAGRAPASWTLMHEYGLTDSDGSRPDFGRWLTEVHRAGIDPATVDLVRFR